MSQTLVTAPTVEPVTLEEAKSHLRVDHSDSDGEILRLIRVARQWAENYTRRAFLTQTWDLKLDCFPSVIEVPRPPLQSVTAAEFKYIAGDGTSTVVPSTVYTVDTDSEPGRVYEAYSQSWPTPRVQPHAVTLRFVAGYGNSAADVPEDIRQGVLLLVSQWHEMREPVIVGTSLSEVPMSVHALLQPNQVSIGF